jgi:predicted DNA-binding ArsR family transcriptional regulator
MISKEQHQKEINKIKREYENILIDIMFSLVDMEEVLETHSFPNEVLEEKIQKIKEDIGKNLKD